MKSPLLRVFAVLSLAVGSLLVPSAAAAQQKMAVVDTERAVMETEDGLRAQATLKKLFDNRQRELDKKQEDLLKERDDIEKQRTVLSQAALAKRVDKWQREMMQLQTLFVEYNKELQKKQGELTGPIIKKMMGVISRIAKKSGYELIIDKQAAPYARSDLDLTEQVIQMYNSGEAGDPAPSDAPKEEKKEEAPKP
jgi:outer membrane protein